METIRNGAVSEFVDWHDTEGNIINASDGGMIFAEGKYHWYGQALGDLPFGGEGTGGQTTSVGVVMYASSDLLHWEYEGVILPVSADGKGELRAPMRFERPKIIYNEKTKQYVLWCHYVGYPGDHGTDAGLGDAGVAVCDTVNGTYEWKGYFRPICEEGSVKDCTLYQDRDGSAYFIFDQCFDAENRCLHFVKLSEDYLSPTDVHWKMESGFHREAPAIVYHDGYYYMITSGLTGWNYNQAKYFRSTALDGAWEDMGDPCVGDDEHTTFRSQTTYIFPVEGKENFYIHMAERHNIENFLHCSYIWLPIRFTEDHRMELHYQTEWNLEK